MYTWFTIFDMARDLSASVPIILFGAFDRHNFGDLLFPHIAATLLGADDLIFAGLAERDMRGYGGHQVMALSKLAEELEGRQVKIIHVGGELLTCDTWEAAVMLLPPDEVQQTLARFNKHPEEKLEWARRQLELSTLVPYTLPPHLFQRETRSIYLAVGGVELSERDIAMQTEVSAHLKAATAVSVRDKRTLALLRQDGIQASLIPDPAVMVAELFSKDIDHHAQEGEVAQMRSTFPQGYIAVQFSADFGDDATLVKIAAQLDQLAISTGYGVVFFRAGAAPWHDDLLSYKRVLAHMRTRSVHILASLYLWDICALIANSRAYCGSSLHGRIVAMAYALPRINLIHPSLKQRPGKQAAFAATWESTDMPATVEVDKMARGINLALATNPVQRLQTAHNLAVQFRQGFAEIITKLD
ncbi:MAG: polysaccharide pyruvyl transferase family protein [Sideroxydans sp.]|nr:polysaccharide pyruvyl transferase family protein [Sideroxydans sp.]